MVAGRFPNAFRARSASLRERELRLKKSGRIPLSRRTQHQGWQGRPSRPQHPALVCDLSQSGKERPAGERDFAPEEIATFNHCEGFLWTIRCYLPVPLLQTEERLSFELQPEMARRLRYHDRKGLLGVERFMKHYFLIAKDVGDLTRIVCSSLELRQLKTVPTLSDFVGTLPWSNRAKLAATTDFRVDNSRLNVKQPDTFQKDPLNLIRFFVEAERNNLLLHPHALRLIGSSLRLIQTHKFRSNPEANKLFLELLTSRNAPETSLRMMNEAGVLGRFIPDFGRTGTVWHSSICTITLRSMNI